jgi:hypothetical protein
MENRKAFPRIPAPTWRRNTTFGTTSTTAICTKFTEACSPGYLLEKKNNNMAVLVLQLPSESRSLSDLELHHLH